MRTTLTCLLLLVLIAPEARAQDPIADPIATARELYAAAEYDEALTMLEGLAAGTHGASDRQARGLSHAVPDGRGPT